MTHKKVPSCCEWDCTPCILIILSVCFPSGRASRAFVSCHFPRIYIYTQQIISACCCWWRWWRMALLHCREGNRIIFFSSSKHQQKKYQSGTAHQFLLLLINSLFLPPRVDLFLHEAVKEFFSICRLLYIGYTNIYNMGVYVRSCTG